jgi:hypothetical protein
MNLEKREGENGPFGVTLGQYRIPENLHEGLIAFIVDGRPTGSFLMAVLQNNLSQACYNADENSAEALVRIVRWLYNEVPGNCWGSPENVADWLKLRHQERVSQ